MKPFPGIYWYDHCNSLDDVEIYLGLQLLPIRNCDWQWHLHYANGKDRHLIMPIMNKNVAVLFVEFSYSLQWNTRRTQCCGKKANIMHCSTQKPQLGLWEDSLSTKFLTYLENIWDTPLNAYITRINRIRKDDMRRRFGIGLVQLTMRENSLR